MSNENLSAGARGDVCSSGAHLYLDDLLLLHEEMADTSQNDALRTRRIIIVERICKSKWKKKRGVREFTHTFTPTHTHTHIVSYQRIHISFSHSYCMFIFIIFATDKAHALKDKR